MTSIIILSIVGAVVAAVVGTIWYSEKTPMGKIHMKYLGFDKLSDEEKKRMIEEARPKMIKMYGAQLVLSALTAFSVVFVVTVTFMNGGSFKDALTFVLMNWICFVVPTIGSAILWSNCDRSIAWKKFFSDTLSILLTMLITAFIAFLFV